MLKRLLGIIYILINKGTVTAAELAERFEVSVRTIYRDIETLSMADIPVYTQRGKSGGICLMEQFVPQNCQGDVFAVHLNNMRINFKYDIQMSGYVFYNSPYRKHKWRIRK